ncbi:RHS repeat domain-containing protein [Butyricicoccus intestinisimiae]|uniref:RHS repeat-associated core domain-containing protein n=1 Tax=Butyricicoccus intestinisimiae TaxID=2841509 RepID=A0ABS6EPN3_9FIRM|nr:RHS repeat-associated core domain-containing protein [Butyricicoccus intestinisimiae]MBU5489448.1 RHS repeat-associated core domain-containing protein [Butyricicoccus intestinisimiae]
MTTAKGNGKSISYHYDMDGVRDSKTVDGVKHEYITQGGNVTLERWNDGEEKSLEFIYDNGGAPYSVIYSRGNEVDTYYYILNQQGDVIRIVDTSGKTVAEYTYNGWGEILNVSNAKGSEIGTLNPIRYRGYYYDSELNMYYLQSRYYDPVMKKMVYADDESVSEKATLRDHNLFSYCDNNPVNRADKVGEFWNIVAGAVVGATLSTAACIFESMIDGEKIEAKSVICAAATGAATGAIDAACPALSALAAGAADAISNAVSYSDKGFSRKEVTYIVASAIHTTVTAALDPGNTSGGVRSVVKKIIKKSDKISKTSKKTVKETIKQVCRIAKKHPSKSVKIAAKAFAKEVKKNLKSHKKNITGHCYNFLMNSGRWIAKRLYAWRKLIK